MAFLNTPKQLSRLTGTVMAIAIFCSALPLAFGSVSWDGKEGVQWLWSDYPEGAIMLGVLALFSWVGYFLLRNHLKTTAA